eukprot:1148672-Pelagomonas_calceolata.AAC.2
MTLHQPISEKGTMLHQLTSQKEWSSLNSRFGFMQTPYKFYAFTGDPVNALRRTNRAWQYVCSSSMGCEEIWVRASA